MDTVNNETEYAPQYLLLVEENLNSFIEKINCLQETFGYSEGMLKQQYDAASKQYDDFVKAYIDNEHKDSYSIPTERMKDFHKAQKRKKRAEMALSLIPCSYVVSLVSLYDSFYAGLVRCVFSLKPEMLNESNKTFVYRDLVAFDSIKEVKKILIDERIDNLLRGSHTEQINWLEKAFCIQSLKKFDGWKKFIELTERRNLFVHSNGVVDSQYIAICQKNGYDTVGISIGTQLSVDKDYFVAAYKLVYQMGIVLSQILLNKLYLGKYSDNTGERDKIFIKNCFELICEKHFDVAISSSIACLNPAFKHTNIDRGYIVLNLAQAYKWNGQDDECNNILTQEDTSSWSSDLLIPKLSLEEKYEQVYIKMLKLGSSSEVMTKEAYRTWPIFNGIRKEQKFAEIFKSIFNEDLIEKNTSVKIDDDESSSQLVEIQ